MKKKKSKVVKAGIIIGIILAIAVVYLGFLQPMTAGENLIANPGFEDGMSQWIGESTDNNHLVGLSITEAHRGDNSLHLSVNNGLRSWYRASTQNSIKLEVGKSYIFTAYYKLKNLQTQKGVSDAEALAQGYSTCYNHPEGCLERLASELYAYTDSQGTQSLLKYGIFSTSSKAKWVEGDWVKVEKTITVKSPQEYIFPKFFLYATNGEAYIDDVSLKEAKTCSSNWGCRFGSSCNSNGYCEKLICPTGFTTGLHSCVAE